MGLVEYDPDHWLAKMDTLEGLLPVLSSCEVSGDQDKVGVSSDETASFIGLKRDLHGGEFACIVHEKRTERKDDDCN